MKTGYKVCDAMTRKPISVSPNELVITCAKLMEDNNVGSLVVKEDNDLKGMITQTDLVIKVIACSKDPKITTAQEIMDTNVNTILPSADIYDAIMHLRTLDIRHLPVITAEGKLCGLLTAKDILKIEPQLFELLVEKFELKEEESKPIFTLRSSEGVCELCGEYSEKLIEHNSSYACRECRTGEKKLF